MNGLCTDDHLGMLFVSTGGRTSLFFEGLCGDDHLVRFLQVGGGGDGKEVIASKTEVA